MKLAHAGGDAENLVGQFAIFRNKHNWVMTWLYTMTFGSFIGYANAFPKLIDDVFGVIRVDAAGNALPEAMLNPNAPVSSKYIWIGAGVGALIRPLGGWLSDKLGGARVTHWDTIRHDRRHDRRRLLRLAGEPVGRRPSSTSCPSCCSSSCCSPPRASATVRPSG